MRASQSNTAEKMSDSRKRSFSWLDDEGLNKYDKHGNLTEPDTKKPRLSTSWLDADWSATSSEGEIFDPPTCPTLGKLRSALNDAFDYEIVEALSERLSSDEDLATKVKGLVDGLMFLDDQKKPRKDTPAPAIPVRYVDNHVVEAPNAPDCIPSTLEVKPSIFSPEIHEMAARAAGHESSCHPGVLPRSPVSVPRSPILDPALLSPTGSRSEHEFETLPTAADRFFDQQGRDFLEGELEGDSGEESEEDLEVPRSVFSGKTHRMAARAGHESGSPTLRHPTFIYPNAGRTGFAPSSPPTPGSRKRRSADEPSARRLNTKRARTQHSDSQASTPVNNIQTPLPDPLGVFGHLPAELRQNVYAHLGLTTRVRRRYITHRGNERFNFKDGYNLLCRHHFITGNGEPKVVFYEPGSSDPQDVDVGALLNLAATCNTIQKEIDPLLCEYSVLSIRIPTLEPGLELSDEIIEACTAKMPWKRLQNVTLSFDGDITADDVYGKMKPFALLEHGATTVNYLCRKIVTLRSLTIVLPEIEEEDKYEYTAVLQKRMLDARVKWAARLLMDECNVHSVLVGGLDMPFERVADMNVRDNEKRRQLMKVFETAIRKWACKGEGDQSEMYDVTGEHLAL